LKVTVFYIGSSLLAPLKTAEREINREFKLALEISAHNFGAPLSDDVWLDIERDLRASEIVFVIHVMDGENASRLLGLLEIHRERHRAVVVINCMPDLMRRTRMGKLDFKRFSSSSVAVDEKGSSSAVRLLGTVGSWLGNQVRSRRNGNSQSHTRYLKMADRLPGLLRFVPNTGALRDVKNYLSLFCYFLQPTPANIQSMVLCALKSYVPDKRLERVKLLPPETMPSVAIYHPDAAKMFESFEGYAKWYEARSRKQAKVSTDQRSDTGPPLDPATTIGLMLMRPQVISKSAKHYDHLIRAIEAEGLSVIPVLATLMDNREACEKFFKAEAVNGRKTSKTKDQSAKTKRNNSRISQLVSLTGFSFVGGPAMNDSEAASEFLTDLNRPYRSAVSLDMQTIESWRSSQTGLNPVQAGMQIAIPEVDGATEPFIYGGIPASGLEPVALEDRSARFARRLRRWNRLRTAPRSKIKLAFVLYCFPPNKGNIGTAADLDVFPSVWSTLAKLKSDGYTVEVPATPDELRERLLAGNSDTFAATTNVAYRLKMDEYYRVCPYVNDIETDWGPAPGNVNSFGGDLLIQGITLGNVFLGVQPTFGYEGDPMRLMMARSGAPHHGFMAFYSYLQQIFGADAVVHVGTHGAMEFMPGKQVGMSGECWPDRLIGELPNLYIYSVNNPSEGSIAKRRSYAELISYLTPPIENAGLYKDLVTLKELVMAYRQTNDEPEMARIFESIEHYTQELNLSTAQT
jgi:magnesium chelatase subunit H